MSRTAFPETTIVRLPAGTLDLIRAAAENAGTTPAEVMRRAVPQCGQGAGGAEATGASAAAMTLPRRFTREKMSYRKQTTDGWLT